MSEFVPIFNAYDLAKKFHAKYPELEFSDHYGLAKLIAEEAGGPIRPCKWLRLPAAKRLASLGLVALESEEPDLVIISGRRKLISRMGYKVQGFDYSVAPAWDKPGKWYVTATDLAIEQLLMEESE
jgi:hypothetical protein